MSILSAKNLTLPLTIVFIMQLINYPIDDEQKVRALETAWLQAMAERDEPVFRELTHRDFEMIYASSVSETKQEILQRWQSKREGDERRIYTLKASVRELTAHEMAIEGIKVIEIISGGQKLIISSKYKDLYRKDCGKWKVFRAYQLPNE
ncbi:MAG: nuclear transport factor 2 family protein [Chitinophagaceae bacterium]|nr:MAG: nuclear transport factor 2 family protein [Chitinophagaceae bacterium]